ncbi:MAG: UbiA family prenyltransferase [Oscillochloris sp.]|nr:UbiA family prenyltransferase [Oscillochloris sp.]
MKPGLDTRRTLGLLGVAAAFHAFAYVHNDVCDLELDRTQPLRTEYPLVRGDISPRAALAVALACVPAAFGIDRWAIVDENNVRPAESGKADLLSGGGFLKRSWHVLYSNAENSAYPTKGFFPHHKGIQQENLDLSDARPPDRIYLLACAFALMAAYNRWGKICPFPPLTDLVQGAGWALLIAYGAAASGHPASQLTQALIVYELLLILMVNGVHGSLRDLGNDQVCGARTTAIMLGAVATTDGLQVAPGLLAYALLLQAALIALPMWVATENLASYCAAHGSLAAFGVSGISGLTTALLVMAARGGVRPTDVGMLHLILLLSAPVALVTPGLGRPLRVATLLTHTLPLLANGMTYDALRWVLKSLRGS